MGPADEKYVSLTTFRKNGERKSTAVWIVEVDDEVGFTTGADSWKLKRLRNDPRCELQACDRRGRVQDGTMVYTGNGREATPEEFRRVTKAVQNKYGLAAKLIELPSKIKQRFGKQETPPASTAVLIKLD